MPNLPKFYYRDLKVRGTCYQELPERDIFIRKYIGRDGFEREKWIRRHPKFDAKWRYHRMVEWALMKGEAPTHPLMMRRYFFKRWFTTMQSEFWQHFLPEFKLSILKELMRMVNQYVNTGKVGESMAEKGTKLDTVFSVLFSSAKNVAIKKAKKNVDSIPLE